MPFVPLDVTVLNGFAALAGTQLQYCGERTRGDRESEEISQSGAARDIGATVLAEPGRSLIQRAQRKTRLLKDCRMIYSSHVCTILNSETHVIGAFHVFRLIASIIRVQ